MACQKKNTRKCRRKVFLFFWLCEKGKFLLVLLKTYNLVLVVHLNLVLVRIYIYI